ncbi:MAG TPA: right-handed parallel beta-helix repeat-containing protein [Sedimentisphaerales bacterium]|nr:right-handed parallel beta-helix repeat-containing protein [Sedimentisphaerales bacterium]
MQTERVKAGTFAVLLVLGVLGLFDFSALGGNLEPSEAPGPTMKRLDEVEPRVAIHTSDLPLTITDSNSYYLVENIDFTDALRHAITIECNDVTIDLMGYTLKGAGSGAKSGIYINCRNNVEIRNGSVRDFYYGICEPCLSAKEHRVINVRAVSNEYSGIYLEGHGHMVKGCTATENGYRGIHAGTGSTVTSNTASDNGGAGIYTGKGCTISNNTAYGNTYGGIHASYGCTVTANTVHHNLGHGIYAGGCCTVTGNTAYENNRLDEAAYAGIRVNYGCLVKGNTATYNKQNNIYVVEDDNVIEGNLLTNCTGCGIYFRVAGNFYANNRASGNGTDYGNTAGNTDGGGNYSF